MNKYYFTARSPTGKKLKSYIKCQSEEELQNIMIEHNFDLLKYKIVKKKKEWFSFNKINDNDIVNLCEKMLMMLKTGIPLSDSIQLCGEACNKNKLKNILLDISNEIKKGKPLSVVFNNYTNTLPSYFITMMGLADVSGKINNILEQLISYYSFKIRIKKKITQSMFYPILLLSLTVIVIIIVCFVIIPSFVSIFNDMHVELPLITKMVIAFSTFIRNFGVFILMGIAGGIVGLLYFFSTKKGKYYKDKFLISIPIIKTVPKINLAGRFCRSLKLLIDSGLSVTQSLSMTANLIDNDYIQNRFSFAIDEIKSGGKLSNALVTMNIFPDVLIETLEVSEKTASLSHSLETMANIFEDDSQDRLIKLTSIIEPMFIIFVVIIVVIIIISIFIPFFSMIDGIAM